MGFTRVRPIAVTKPMLIIGARRPRPVPARQSGGKRRRSPGSARTAPRAAVHRPGPGAQRRGVGRNHRQPDRDDGCLVESRHHRAAHTPPQTPKANPVAFRTVDPSVVEVSLGASKADERAEILTKPAMPGQGLLLNSTKSRPQAVAERDHRGRPQRMLPCHQPQGAQGCV